MSMPFAGEPEASWQLNKRCNQCDSDEKPEPSALHGIVACTVEQSQVLCICLRPSRPLPGTPPAAKLVQNVVGSIFSVNLAASVNNTRPLVHVRCSAGPISYSQAGSLSTFKSQEPWHAVPALIIHVVQLPAITMLSQRRTELPPYPSWISRFSRWH